MQSPPFNSAELALSGAPRRLRNRPRAAKALVASVVASSMIFASAAASSASTSHLRPAGSASSGAASGTLNWEWELPTSWDPVTSSAGWDNHVLSLVYATITTVLPNGNVGPGLASSWSYASNGLSVTFTLRPGLSFTDGTPLDAQAVAENIERGQDPGQLDDGLGAEPHLQGCRQQPDELHARPQQCRLPESPTCSRARTA